MKKRLFNRHIVKAELKEFGNYQGSNGVVIRDLRFVSNRKEKANETSKSYKR